MDIEKPGFELSLLTSENCNMRCSYCYEHKERIQKKMSWETAQSIIEKAKKSEHFNGWIEFFGGEPTLNTELIQKITTTYPELNYMMISNGTWIWNELKIETIMNLDSVVISIEGTDKSYQTIRNQPSVMNVVTRIHEIRQQYPEEDFAHISFNISVNGLLLDDWDEFVENMQYIDQCGFGVYFYTIRGTEDYFQNNEQYFQFLMKLQQDLPDLFDVMLRLDQPMYAYPKEMHYQGMCEFDNVVTCTFDGNLIPCTRYRDLITKPDQITDLYDYYKIINTTLGQTSRFPSCDTCILREEGKHLCWLQCPAFLDEMIETEEKQIRLHALCEREKIKYMLRLEEIERRNLTDEISSFGE